MKNTAIQRYVFTFVILLLSSVSVQAAMNQKDWWNIAYPSAFDSSTLKPQDTIKVDGNVLVDGQGKPFLFKGMNLAAPDKLVYENQWNKALFEELKDWGVNTIRLPIHPIGWRATGEKEYLKLIDEAVVWANDLGIYLIVDWHSIGYLPDGLFQHPMYETTEQETMKFWQTIAKRYAGVPTIAVYEIFNEPTDIGGRAGKANWAEWKAFNEQVIDLIYAHDRNVIPLVAGFNWAYDLRPAMDDPIERAGVAYASHPYPQKEAPDVANKENFFKLWDAAWGNLAKNHPIIATELGWVTADGPGAHIPVINDGSYGPMIIEYMDERNISWVAWCFDPHWSPTMIKDWNFTPTQQGAFFKKVLRSQQP